MSKRARVLAAGLVVAVVLAGVWWAVLRHDGDGREELGVTQFERALDDGAVAQVELHDRSNRLLGELEDGTRFVVRYPNEYTDELTTRIIDAGLELQVLDSSSPFIQQPLQVAAGQADTAWTTLVHPYVINPPFWEVT